MSRGCKGAVTKNAEFRDLFTVPECQDVLTENNCMENQSLFNIA